ARLRAERAVRLSGGPSGALLREAAVPLRAARARGADDLPRARAGDRRARRGAGAPLRPRGGGRVTGLAAQGRKVSEGSVSHVLERARGGADFRRRSVDTARVP